MDIRQINRDPMPTAERGTLEYAASAACMTIGVQIVLSATEARELHESLNGRFPQPRDGLVAMLIEGLKACAGHTGEDS